MFNTNFYTFKPFGSFKGISSPIFPRNKLFSTDSKENSNNISNFDLFKNTLDFYSKLNGNVPINDFDPNYFGSNAFYRIKSILSSTNTNLNEKQELLEKTFKDLWDIELNLFFKNAKSLENRGIRLLIESLSILTKDFDTLFNDKKLLARKDYLKSIAILDYSNIISICLSKVLPFIVFKDNDYDQKVTPLYESIGIALYKEVVKTNYQKDSSNNKLSYKDYFLNNYNYSEDDAIRLGSYIADFIGQKSDLYYIDSDKRDPFKSKRVIFPSKLFDDLMKNFIILDSYEAPMLIKPVEWKIQKGIKSLENSNNKIIKYGGYLNNDRENFEELIRKSKESVGDSIIIDNKIVQMINYMSGISFRLNNKILDYLVNLILNQQNTETVKDILNDLNLSFHPNTILLDYYKKELNKATAQKDNTNINNFKNLINDVISHNSKFLYNKSILTMAILFKDVKDLYFPLKLDWRGRIYIKGGVLNIQGGELSRSLLMFSKSVKLDTSGVEALKIYCANAFGKDKISKIKRLEWVDENINKIIDIESMFWTKADDKLIALASCFELKGYLEDPDNFESSLPILIDATCNGLQHLSAMIHDINLAEKVNLLESSKEMNPEDLYSFMVDPIKSEINEKASTNIEYSRLASFNIDRSFIKIPIMTISYNITPHGICEQLIRDKFIQKDLIDKDPETLKKNPKYTKMYLYQSINPEKYGDVLLSHQDIFNLSTIIYNSLYETYPKLNSLKEYFNSMTNVLTILNLPVIWVTPSGLYIKQKYVEFTTYDIINNVLSKRKSITLRKPMKLEEKLAELKNPTKMLEKIAILEKSLKIEGKQNYVIDNIKQRQSFIPNYVHSMDACNIFLLYDGLMSLNNKIDIITIHDCFGTHANDVNNLSILVKNAFVSIYKDDKYLKKFHKTNLDCIKSLVPVKRNKFVLDGKDYFIPAIPKVNKLNLEYHLPKSLYFLN